MLSDRFDQHFFSGCPSTERRERKKEANQNVTQQIFSVGKRIKQTLLKFISSLWDLIFTVIYKITLSFYKLFYLKVVKRKLKLVLLENDSRLSRFCEMRFL